MSQAFHISSVWADDSLAPDEIGKRIMVTLGRLERLAPIMRNWCFLDRRSARGIPLAEAEPRMAALVRENVKRDDFGEPEVALGYGIRAYGWDVPEWDARTVEVDFHTGSEWSNEIDFRIGAIPFPGDPPQPTDFSVVTHPVFKGAMETFAAVWPLPWALAHSFDAEKLPIDAPAIRGSMRSSPFAVAWIAYLSAALTTGLEVPPEIVAEPTPGGGLVLSALDEPVNQMNADHMRRSRVLERIMLDRVGVGGTNRSGCPSHPARIGPY